MSTVLKAPYYATFKKYKSGKDLLTALKVNKPVVIVNKTDLDCDAFIINKIGSSRYEILAVQKKASNFKGHVVGNRSGIVGAKIRITSYMLNSYNKNIRLGYMQKLQEMKVPADKRLRGQYRLTTLVAKKLSKYLYLTSGGTTLHSTALMKDKKKYEEQYARLVKEKKDVDSLTLEDLVAMGFATVTGVLTSPNVPLFEWNKNVEMLIG